MRGNDIAMIFQEPMTSLNPVFTIGDQIAEALTCHRADDRKAEAKAETIRLLEKVRIPTAASRFDEYPHQLSGGMRQRVMIAMALACRPKLLIADEPTTALDVTIQAQILELIKVLQEEEGMSVLFITHDMGVVAEIADRTVVMFRGEAVETGRDRRHLPPRPDIPIPARLLSAVPRLGSMDGPQAGRCVSRSSTSTTGESDRCRPRSTDTVAQSKPPVLEVNNLVNALRHPLRPARPQVPARVHAVENVSFDLHAGRDAVAGRRIRLRQVDHRPRRSCG